ncbi:MAG: hypothetical protein HXY51_11815 [Nitrospirae bacterium]|nr:hypothetical protein [Nitrospirota bacterium]
METKKQWLIKGLFLPAIALCFLLLFGTAAHAALVTYSFTGGVSTISGGLLATPVEPSPLSLGLPVTGSFQFNTGTGGVGGNYPGAVTAMTLSIGSYTSSLALGANAVTIFQNTSLGGGLMGDRWKLVAAATGLPVKGYTPFSVDLQLDREGGGLFSDTDLENPPSMNSLTATRWRLLFQNDDGNVVTARGTFQTLTAVPLPAAAILFAVGLIALVGLGAGGLRNLRRPQA